MMKNTEYRYININEVESRCFKKDIPVCLGFEEADLIFNDKDKIMIGSTDDGWSSIQYLDGKFYHIQSGLQEYEGHVYVTEVVLTNDDQAKEAWEKINDCINERKERQMLISTIRNSSPSPDLFDAFNTLKLGQYVGGFVDTWKWNGSNSFKDITIGELRLMERDLDMCWEKWRQKRQSV